MLHGPWADPGSARIDVRPKARNPVAAAAEDSDPEVAMRSAVGRMDDAIGRCLAEYAAIDEAEEPIDLTEHLSIAAGRGR